MCGIAGIWNFSKKIERKALEKLTKSLSHRGPDGMGIYLDDSENIGLGHCRLAILDLSNYGKQPMAYANERYWISYNGEIYNFIELRTELEGYGYQFRSQSDTEVILAAYHKWGKGCLHKFNGMWAFAIWDKESKNLFLSRDRFGIKPLYYLYIPGNFFAFSSETVTFSCIDGFRREFDEENISRVLEDVFCLEGYGKTIFKNIVQLLPGHSLTLSKEGGLTTEKWWSTFEHIREVPRLYEQQVEEFRDLLRSSCLLRMRSDVPISTSLSGGVDSSAIYCMLNDIRHNSHHYERTPQDWHRAFIAEFPGCKYDEKAYALEVVRYVNGSARFFSPASENLAEKIISATVKSDYIYLTPDIASDIYKLMRNDHVFVSLDGHGGDEMLLGYQPLVGDAYLAMKRHGRHEYANDLFDTFVNMYDIDSREKAKRALLLLQKREKLNFFYHMYKYIPDSLKHAYRNFKKISSFNNGNFEDWLLQKPKAGQAEQNIQNITEKSTILSDVEEISYRIFHQTSLPTLLRNFDRASMRNGVEIRMPLLDWRLVTYAFSIPLESKAGGGYTKRILRDAMIGLMPENIRTRKIKIGLNAPMIEWFSGVLSEFIMDEVNSQAFLSSNIWNGPAIRDFAEAKVKNKSWNWDDCVSFWPYLNAHILMR